MFHCGVHFSSKHRWRRWHRSTSHLPGHEGSSDTTSNRHQPADNSRQKQRYEYVLISAWSFAEHSGGHKPAQRCCYKQKFSLGLIYASVIPQVINRSIIRDGNRTETEPNKPNLKKNNILITTNLIRTDTHEKYAESELSPWTWRILTQLELWGFGSWCHNSSWSILLSDFVTPNVSSDVQEFWQQHGQQLSQLRT